MEEYYDGCIGDRRVGKNECEEQVSEEMDITEAK